MLLVAANGLNRAQIETLDVEQGFEKPLFQHIHEVPGNAAATETALDLALAHHLAHVPCHGQRYTARPGLEREAVFHIARGLDDHRRVLGDLQADRIGCNTRR